MFQLLLNNTNMLIMIFLVHKFIHIFLLIIRISLNLLEVQ